MIKTDGIILDVDGTIWNTTGVVAEAWNKAIEETYPQVKRVTAEILQSQFGKTMDIIADNLFPELNKEQKDKLLDKCCDYEHKQVSENTTNITYENVVETIKELSKSKKLFIVSNCQSGYIELVMEKNGITEFITDFECYGDTKLAKNENIKLICKRNNLSTPVYVGDTAGDASECALAEVPFIWAAYGFGSVEKNEYIAKIQNFGELQKIIE